MERVRQLDEYWSWLPAFRAVAETEHLPSAAAAMHSNASSLSRAVQKLEQRLGHRLFERNGRRIERSDAGTRLLEAVREAMRRVDEAVRELESHELSGRFAIASAGYVTQAYLLPALDLLRESHPKLVPELPLPRPGQLAEDLLQGRVDLALLGQPLRHPILETVPLCKVRSSIYCSEEHPLRGRDRVDADELAQHAFVAPPPGPNGQSVEGWPASLERRVGLFVDSMQIGLEACARGPYLAVLPDVAVRHHPGPPLHRLPFELDHEIDIFAIYRPQLREHSDVDIVLDAIRTVVAAEAARGD
jgi:DNA-binding transcriptional LysR family regulator